MEPEKKAGIKAGPYYTNYYTNALGKGLFHGRDRAVLHVGQDVAVGVERYRDGGMPQHLGDDLGVYVLEQQYGRGGIPQLVGVSSREGWPVLGAGQESVCVGWWG